MKRLIFINFLILILTACAETGSSLTLEANYYSAGTQVQDLRITATVQAARARTTLDFMETRAVVGGTQSSFLIETLVATGFSPDMLATQQAMIMGSSPTAAPLSSPGSDTGQLSGTPSPPGVTLNAPISTSTAIIQPTPDFGGLSFGTLITATGSGNDGCGTGVRSLFGMDVSEIYAILPAFNITANTYTFAARWQRNGQPVGPVYDFTPDFDSESLCIWFFVDETDFIFEPGNYSVSIDINGQQAAGPVPFVIQ